MRTNKSSRKFQCGTLLGGLMLALVAHAGEPLSPGDAIPVAGHGGFDFIRMDAAGNRLLLGHAGNKSFDVFDLGSMKLLKSVPTSTSQDAAADAKRGSYYVSGNDPGRMVIVNSTTLEIVGDVPTPAKTD